MQNGVGRVIFACLLAACSAGDRSSGPASVASVTITSPNDILQALGATGQLTATAYDAAGASISGKTFVWNSSAPGIVSVDASGLATAVANGQASITAMVDGIAGTTQLTVRQTTATIVVTPGDLTLTGVRAVSPAFSAVASDANSHPISDATFTWSSGGANIATVSADGIATATGLGTTTISASVAGVTGNASLTVTAHFYVDAAQGNDANSGTSVAPFKRITKALQAAAAGNTIKVRPGRYDRVLGESFPLSGLAGVILVGDEPNKGGGTTPTTVINRGIGGVGVFTPASNAIIAGFTVTDSALDLQVAAVRVASSSVTLRNNRLINNNPLVRTAIWVQSGTGHLITGNVIAGHAGYGVLLSSGSSVRVEHNVITNNASGIVSSFSGGNGTDLGGGANGSVGNNIISCNRLYDLWVEGGHTVAAANNQWDHVPPTTSTLADTGPTADIFNRSGANTVTTTGATVASTTCP